MAQPHSNATADQEQELVREETPDRKFFTITPNIIDDMELSPYAYRLYGRLKRVCGETVDGRCWQNRETLAAACKMSTGAVTKARQDLQDAGLIRVHRPSGKRPPIITIVNIWERNITHFTTGDGSRRSGDDPSYIDNSPPRSENPPHSDDNPSIYDDNPSPHDAKKNPGKKNSDCSLRSQSADGEKPAVVPMGNYGITQLMDRVIAARQRGVSIHSPTNDERKNFGAAFNQCAKDGHDIDTMLLALDYMVAKASGQIKREPKAWCGYRTALDNVIAGWRPSSGDPSLKKRRSKEDADRHAEKMAALIREAERQDQEGG